MRNLSLTAWIAIAAVAAVPASIAIAKSMDGKGWQRPSPETRARLDEGRIAMAKAALKLTPEQEKLFTPVEEQVRAAFKSREEKRAEREKMREERRAARKDGAEKSERKRPDLAERFEKMSVRMAERAERMKAFAGAFKPFYASLTDEQKDVLRPLIRDLAPGFGGGRKGSRWAHGGGWGPGGRGHGGWHGHHRGEGRGPMMDSGDDAAGAGNEAPASAPTPPETEGGDKE